jgi:hypothetical protein
MAKKQSEKFSPDVQRIIEEVMKADKNFEQARRDEKTRIVEEVEDATAWDEIHCEGCGTLMKIKSAIIVDDVAYCKKCH